MKKGMKQRGKAHGTIELMPMQGDNVRVPIRGDVDDMENCEIDLGGTDLAFFDIAMGWIATSPFGKSPANSWVRVGDVGILSLRDYEPNETPKGGKKQ